jgi:hypothetical protein
VPENSWNPPTGPPNGEPVHPADARREIEDALDAARARDRQLRDHALAVAVARVRMSDRHAAATDEIAEAEALAKRALARSHDSAQAGQRADAAKWTGAAEVFAMRLRDARAEVEALDQQLVAASEQAQRTETALVDNVGRLQAIAVSRLPMLSTRKSGRLQRAVDETIAVVAAPIGDLAAQATAAARAADDRAAAERAAADEPGEAPPLSDDELEHEVDYDGIDAILADLRSQLGLPAPAGPRPAERPAPASSASAPAASEPAESAPPASDPPAHGRSWPVPTARR